MALGNEVTKTNRPHTIGLIAITTKQTGTILNLIGERKSSIKKRDGVGIYE